MVSTRKRSPGSSTPKTVARLSTLSRLRWRASPAATAETLSGGAWHRAPHLDHVSRVLVRELAKPGARVLIDAPPRHGKSELCSGYLPVWGMAELRRPRPPRVMLASYSGDYALTWGRFARNVVMRNAELLGFNVSPDSAAAGSWETTAGASMITAGVGGTFTGLGADLLIIDDPFKNWIEAFSTARREQVWDWYRSTARTRLEPGAAIVVIATRWHPDDLTGRLDALGAEGGRPWTRIHLPAMPEESDPVPDALGRELGAPLWPERFGREELEEIREDVGPMVWAALYQGAPKPAGSRLFPIEGWRTFHGAPSVNRIIVSWDMSFKATAGSDWVVGQAWGFTKTEAYLLDLVRGRWDFERTCSEFEAFAKRWPNASATLIEDKANGPAVLSTFRRKIRGLVAIEPQGSKIERAAACQPFHSTGALYVPADAPWVPAFTSECHAFPGGKNDDQVDAFSQAVIFAWLTGPTPPPRLGLTSAGLTSPSAFRGQ